MIEQPTPTPQSATDEPDASRRDFVAAAVTMAAAAGAAGERAGADASEPALLQPARHVDAADLQPRGRGQRPAPHRLSRRPDRRRRQRQGRRRLPRPDRAGDGEHQDRARLGRRRLRARGQDHQLPDQPRGQRRRVPRGARLLLHQQGGAAGLARLLQVPRLANPAYLRRGRGDRGPAAEDVGLDLDQLDRFPARALDHHGARVAELVGLLQERDALAAQLGDPGVEIGDAERDVVVELAARARERLRRPGACTR